MTADMVTVAMPDGSKVRMTKDDARSLIGQLASLLRGSFAGGRPAIDGPDAPRCECRLMTLRRARARYHKCGMAAAGEKREKAGKRGKGEKTGLPGKSREKAGKKIDRKKGEKPAAGKRGKAGAAR